MTLAPTSIAAAQSIAPVAPCLREQVFAHIESQRTNGATIDETHLTTGIATSTVCGRFDELKKAGRIVPAGFNRPTSSGSPAAVWVTTEFRVKLDRKLVAAHIAKMGDQGATRSDLLRVLTAIKSDALDEAIRGCWAHGATSDMAGEIRQGEKVYHITKRGLCALRKIPAGNWHVDMGGDS
jgi:hypothetical protein